MVIMQTYTMTETGRRNTTDKRETRRVRRNATGRGFTIIEMIVVITIIALLAGAVGGRYIKPYKRALLNKAARDVLLAARYARTAAVEQQKICRLVLDPALGQIAVRVESWNEEQEQTTESEVRNQYWRTVSLAGDARLEMVLVQASEYDAAGYQSPDTGEYAVVFRPDGTADNALIQVGDGIKHYLITISGTTGLPRVEEGTAEEFRGDTIDLDEKAG
jgi:prepilin-type N-terminal cleavage/methylation domain-containing protein